MSITRNTYNSGINKSTSKSKYQPENYYDGENIRIISGNEGLSTGAVINIQGNELAFSIPDTYEIFAIELLTSGTDNIVVNINGTITNVFIDSAIYNTIPKLADQFRTALGAYITSGDIKIQTNLTQVVIVSLNSSMSIISAGPNTTNIINIAPALNKLIPIGYSNLRDTIILFTTNDDTTIGGYGQIWSMTYDNTSAPYVYTIELLYNNNVNFTTQHLIRTQGDYENDITQIVAFTDNYNPLRFFNTKDPNSFAIPIENLDAAPNVFFDIPVLENIVGGGVLPIGEYQYAYRYSNVSGSKTPFSPLSANINIILPNESSIYENYYPQAPTGTFPTTSKSIEIRIDNIDERFDQIEVVSIYTNTAGTTPEVKLFQTIPVTQGPIYVTNSGAENSISLTIEDVLQNGNPFTTCKDITVKDSRLLAANTSNTKFIIEDSEFDSRAYRFPSKTLYSTSGLTWFGGFWDATNVDTSTKVFRNNWSLSYNADAINPNQLPGDEGTTITPTYKFQSNGTTMGGEGKYIKYEIVKETINDNLVGDYLVNNTVTSSGSVYGKRFRIPGNGNQQFSLNNKRYNNNSWDSFISPYVQANFKGYQHEETYRFAIRFYDKKGRRSFDKWIGDITMPTIEDCGINFSHSELINGNNNQVFRVLGIKFTVTLPQSVKDKIGGYEIVRVERDDNNKTILASGNLWYCSVENLGIKTLFTTPHNKVIPGYFENDMAVATYTFQSPDFKLGDFKGLQQGDEIRIAAIQVNSNNVQDNKYDFRKLYRLQSTSIGTGYKVRYIMPLDRAVNINNGSILNTSTLVPEGTFFNQRPLDSSSMPFRTNSYGNNTILLSAASSPAHSQFVAEDSLINTSYADKYYAYYYRALTKQYGGNTFNERANNQYISTNSFRTITSNSSLVNTDLVFGGDVFLSIYDSSKMFKNWNDPSNSNNEAYVFWSAVESTVNPEWRRVGGPPASTVNRDGITEPGDVNIDSLATYETAKTQPVYEQSNDARYGYSEPLNFQNIDYNDNRIYASEVKFSGETSNSWSVFKTNNYRDVDNPYGPINAIGSYKGQVVFFQNNAFGILPVNLRALTSDTSGAPLQIGTGEVLSKHEYISTRTGAFHQRGVNYHEYGVDFFDINAMKMYRFGGEGLKCLSDDGLEQEFAKRLQGNIKVQDNPLYSAGISCIYDYKYNESIFTFKDVFNNITTKFTLAYSDKMNAYSSFYSFYPAIYISNKKDLFTPDYDNTTAGLQPTLAFNIYRHNVGEYGKFYSHLFPSSVTSLVNPQSNITKTFDNLIIQSEVIDTNNLQINETINLLQCSNDYQDTGIISLIPTVDIRRRFRTWTTTVPRDAANAAYTSISHPRMTDKYLLVKMTFTNNNNKKFILHDLVTAFRPIESLRGQVNE